MTVNLAPARIELNAKNAEIVRIVIGREQVPKYGILAANV